MGNQPDLQNIDREIRRLVYLLNEIPYVQTTSSCSGHPDDPDKDWFPGGSIFLQPADDDVCAFWAFLDELRVKLNGTDHRMLEFSRQIDAQALYTSTAPLVEIGPRPPHDGNFHIRLIVKSSDVRRTRQEHSKMWRLVDAAVLQLEPQLEQVNLPAECQPLTPEEKTRKTEREARRREEERTLDELVAKTQSGDKQAYQRLYEQIRPIVQKILARRIIENRETIEGEILSYLFKNIHLFRPELVSFKTWVNRVTLNLVVKYQKQLD